MVSRWCLLDKTQSSTWKTFWRCRKNSCQATVRDLLRCLESMDRFDVIDDLKPMLEADCRQALSINGFFILDCCNVIRPQNFIFFRLKGLQPGQGKCRLKINFLIWYFSKLDFRVIIHKPYHWQTARQFLKTWNCHDMMQLFFSMIMTKRIW